MNFILLPNCLDEPLIAIFVLSILEMGVSSYGNVFYQLCSVFTHILLKHLLTIAKDKTPPHNYFLCNKVVANSLFPKN